MSNEYGDVANWLSRNPVKKAVKKVQKKNSFPEPNCEGYGYSWDYLEEIMDPEIFKEFSHWMRGQTCMLCDGRQYNHEKKQYEPSACANNPHGGVAYTWDVKRFLGIIPGKELWD